MIFMGVFFQFSLVSPGYGPDVLLSINLLTSSSRAWLKKIEMRVQWVITMRDPTELVNSRLTKLGKTHRIDRVPVPRVTTCVQFDLPARPWRPLYGQGMSVTFSVYKQNYRPYYE